MGMVRYCSRAHGFQICNGDCLHCSRYPDQREKEVTQYASKKSQGRIPIRQDREGVQEQGESRETGSSY